jgi:hypothetical protein
MKEIAFTEILQAQLSILFFVLKNIKAKYNNGIIMAYLLGKFILLY